MTPINMRRFVTILAVLAVSTSAFGQVWINTNVAATSGPLPGTETNVLAPTAGVLYLPGQLKMLTNLYLFDDWSHPLHLRLNEVVSNVVAVGSVASNQTPEQSWTVWKDAQTNYIARNFAGTRTTNASFSALLNAIIVPTNSGCVVEIGPSLIAAGQYAPFYIDTPIEVANFNGFTLRGKGNYGTTISPADGYDGRMFVATNMSGITRFENIRFQAGTTGKSQNTNTCLELIDCAEVLVRDCEFDRFVGSAIRHANLTRGSAWNGISQTYFVGATNMAGPMLDISGSGSGPISDYIVSQNHFYAQNTNQIIRLSGDVMRNAQIVGNRIGTYADTAVKCIRIDGGYGHLISGNAFYASYAASRFVEFVPAASNDFAAAVVGNTFGMSYGTNAIFISSNAHGVVISGNSLGSCVGGAKIKVEGDNLNGAVVQGYGVTSSNMYRGEWGAAASNLASTAYGWGNHADAGYLTEETDPVFSAWRTNDDAGLRPSTAASVSGGQVTLWCQSNSIYTLDLTGANTITAAVPWVIQTNGWTAGDIPLFGLKVMMDSDATWAWPVGCVTNVAAPTVSSTNFYMLMHNGATWCAY